MKLPTKIAFMIVGACSLLALAQACETPKCFDCNTCDKDCSKVKQDCDSNCIVQVREFLCKMETDNCKEINGCNVPPTPVTIYPAASYDESRPEWKSQTFQARKNCCYKLSGIYDNTLSGIKNNGACVVLYDGADCTGASVKVDSTWSADCLKWIECPARINAGGILFNDKTSSFQLC